jgi:hypothetical protein
MDAVREEWKQLKLNLEALFLAGDTNRDGKLSFDEFACMMLQAEPLLPDFRVRRLYRQVSMHILCQISLKCLGEMLFFFSTPKRLWFRVCKRMAKLTRTLL